MEYFLHLAILVAVYAILGISLNLIIGYTGLPSLAHAAFYGIGAYTVAILSTYWGMNFFPAVLFGLLASAGISFLIGIVLSRFRGDLYVLGTIGFNFIVFSIFLNWENLTRGPIGITGIPRPHLWGLQTTSSAAFLLIAAVFLFGVYGISHSIVGSSFGRALKAIREDEQALEVFGYRALSYKLVIFVISAAMASLAGGLFASYIQYIDPSLFTLNESIFILAIVILGGLANLRGSLVGALFLILLPEALRFVGFPSDIAAQMRQAVYGLILILLMLYRPQGLVGEYKL